MSGALTSNASMLNPKDFGTRYNIHCLVLAKVDTFMNNKKCVKQCERVQQSTAMSSN